MTIRYPRLRRAALIGVLLTVATTTAGRAEAQSAPASGRHFLWKVTAGAKTLYLAGSVHALTADAYPLDPAYDRAFAASGTLVGELDLNEAAALAAGPALVSRGMFTDGRTFDQVVSRETVAMTADRLKTLGLPMEPLQRMKPWMVMLMLTALETGKAGLDPALGLDKHFFDKAKASGKPVIGLETVEFQIDRFDQMPMLTQEQMLRNTLSEIDAQSLALQELLTAWRTGDVAGMERTVLGGFEQYPAAYTSLIVERNRQWMAQLDACLAKAMPCFVVVGAAHLVGPDGILAALRARGYRVEQL